LGKLFVQQLGLEPGTDTLSKWMAHYVAEQITAAERATGEDKSRAEERCFETVLKLWQHRWSLPNGRRPFETFEPILHALERLNPENSGPYYFPPPKEEETSGRQTDTVNHWVRIAFDVDRTARVLIEFALVQASLNAADKKARAWLKNAADMVEKKDIAVLIHFVPPEPDKNGAGAELEQIQQWREDALRSKLASLGAFLHVSKTLKSVMRNELEELRKRRMGTARKKLRRTAARRRRP
jgi:hypothetical protein